MKKLLSLLILFVFAHSVMADDMILQIQKVDGHRLFVYLSDEPMVYFSEGKLIVQSAKETLSMPLSTVRKYTFESVNDGIESLQGSKVVIKRTSVGLKITGLDKNAVIKVFSSSGKLMRNFSSNGSSSQVNVIFNDFPAGVYVLDINGANYKFTKK